MRTGDVVRIARDRAGWTQQQLAARSGRPRETIARWEAGTQEPSLAALQDLVDACDLELVLNLARRDFSLRDGTRDQLALKPTKRLASLPPTDVRAPWHLEEGGTVVLASQVPGTRDYPDLRRAALTVDVGDGPALMGRSPAGPAPHRRRVTARGRASMGARAACSVGGGQMSSPRIRRTSCACSLATASTSS
jgi:transcriptional regulator with XRE-family HTH domain